MYLLAILWITVKRILHNWKVVGALLGGLVLAAGVMAAIPIYSAGSLQSSFFREWMAEDTFRPPFTLIVTHTNDRRVKGEKLADLTRMEQALDRDIRQSVGQRPIARSDYASLGDCVLLPSGGAADLSFSAPRAELSWMSGLENLAQIVQGRWYQPRDDGVVEVVVDETTLEQGELLVGQRLTAWYELQEDEVLSGAVEGAVPIPVEVVGFFRARPGFTTKDWIYPPPFFNRGFVDPTVFRDQLMGKLGLRAERWDMEWVFAPEPVQVGLLPGIIARLEAAGKRATQVLPNTGYWLSPVDFFRSYNLRATNVALFLTALATPLMGMLFYYIVLMAGIAVQHRSKEILVMHSRGAGRLQAVLSFFLEWLLLGAVAALVGPLLGVFIAKVMGASSGFLSFVNREAIPAFASPRAFHFSLAASLLAVAAGMGPVFATFRHTIVTFTRRGARRTRSLWHRLFLDVILLAAAGVAYRELMWQSTRLAPDETVAADPILFFVPVVFLLGAGLLLLRIYPFLLAGMRWAIGRLPGVVWQLTLRRLTRNAAQYFPLLLLLILTLSLGIYSASTARTLSRNFDDRIRFEVGADLAVKEEWHPPERASTGVPTSEPPFLKRLDLPGVLSAARVLKGGVDVTVGGEWELGTSGNMMAISPVEFARTAWFRSDFGKASFVDYLSLLARHREGVLVSSGFFKDQKLSLGQELHFVFHDQPFDAYVAGVVDLWPTMDPSRSPFFILNLEFVQENTRLEPYEVWYRLSDHDHVQEMVSDMVTLGVYPIQVRDTEAMITALKHEPYRMGFFGILSLGFVIAALITVLGFLVYTYFSIRGRLLQFGALRAMGLSRLQLSVLLVLEQLFTLGAGLAAGVGLGSLCSRLFLPFLRARAAELQPVPPFLLVSDRMDTLYALIVLVALFLGAVIGLTIILARMKINRALTLGEEVEP